ncbi:MAG: Asp-tRNA(Asn)/Glu-tRNA(Gln) amidotransferase subunit GatB [Lactobacillus sp.]|mgnify:CR=1 FL=1|jgi:aspartyl-tRNA(Asn)/glutamyl-tRNA(Gln) amidotransferase subunit B|uniref:Aspartyl/glutamyl-tRNA(Asn/Gln) amidotransferase subunit B n=1 Tax=Lacticaseibacillus suilingensis TaxID=2799577 RepID=A0ABW4BG60_9LACO|nr:Asp-tRNA(Asn)/Glu-tRNA(Gln) amidotransferase subunit GatB [Lacticaseibacillus suilingensis]MCI1893908.1 Asp-tRNA(Asn)/Glu-tRNA(Gln) amidotransferase subunit GatB [Lactobacillus sp.]MCI1918051.1 Asp-tRNA(Asn)/Glu-tRNA(Gln) amidotransferase subunit GatB [Lactobacillus sp.]MCI1941932.1 Asp-tRNA(Asn)/Glu-tRNA(Gln) amidotransferase subunit GatB [Lactobacillus sp.]MCI1972862.1 Asp-tRNA(Asn)/Glu-tRNA(Gln) amidotransferase subunit GatB [Lactobacillus sp.]MCI2016702.1 Asp-tRNA(Asn)/Glu-tRNA(Gln) ami
MNFETTIGLEVHVELKTKSKMYSPTPVSYGAEPNINTNVIDWGFPGTLPTVNKGAYSYGMMVAIALHADITRHTHFDRKNYFYPDNPKAYQITQSETPLATNGWIEIEVDGKKKKIGIHELHVEEDAGKNQHEDDGYSYVDLNRQGTPLVEIVSEPDIASPEEAYQYLEQLRQIVQFTGASDVKMEEGSMRVDTNLSVRPIGATGFGVKTEIKNLNSFNHVRDGLAFEQKRQVQVLMAGGQVRQETRRWDPAKKETILMRVKEGADDYRYFPEPDLPPVFVSQAWIDDVTAKLPEAPAKRRARYINEWGIPAYDAGVLTLTMEMANFFEATVAAGADPKQASNWLMGEVSGYLNAEHLELKDVALTPSHLAEMIKLIADGTISSKIAKKVFQEIIKNDTDPKAWVEEKGMVQLSDPAKLTPIIDGILDDNAQSIEDFKNGKDRAIGFLVGQIMKQTHGKANPKVVNQILMSEIKKR